MKIKIFKISKDKEKEINDFMLSVNVIKSEITGDKIVIFYTSEIPEMKIEDRDQNLTDGGVK